MTAKDELRVAKAIAGHELGDLVIAVRAAQLMIDDTERVRELTDRMDEVTNEMLKGLSAVTNTRAEWMMCVASNALAFAMGTLELCDQCPGGIDVVRGMVMADVFGDDKKGEE